MHHLVHVIVSLAIVHRHSVVLALPTPQIGDYGENSGPVGGVKPPMPTVTAASGSLRGDSSLLGGNAPLPDPGKSDPAVVPNPELVNGQEAGANLGLYLDFDSANPPQPIRGTEGSTDPGPRTFDYEKLNPDLFTPPGTDGGSVPSLMWPMGLSHNRPGTGTNSGWARQQNTDVLPAAKAMAGVDMRLAPNSYRELHWHTASEWALMLKGCTRVAAVDDEGRSFIDDVCAGDVWFFPAGVPHSIQAFGEGAEFLLVFDDGGFSEDGTFLVSEMFQRNPLEVLSKDLRADVSAFDDLPKGQLYIFNGTPAPEDVQQQNTTSSAGALTGNNSFTYHWSLQQPFTTPGGSVKILDPQTFPVAKMFSTALITIQPGAMREMHWHTTSDEWSFFLQGSGRITVYVAPAASRTFDYTAGGVGYVPAGSSHYIENTGDEDLIVLEVLQAPKFSDISVAQWLALTPKQVIKDHLHLPDSVIDALPKEKPIIVPGNKNLTALAGGGRAF
ncbi:RmlC-like cupin domain-containing protein [Lasiosphaeria miniovina]|uniref:RmlC-like cupin domain-containing protein n=1 Tax=Lasiosphaeria miniovina TaxID=1954250 RepID=A0AA40E5E9_9PEZI|nr:RmlC-like cupin domain-containing protein [Lasiosphaeria miniovina]KAK0728869.1 RmlC-like cupin domain-containing protein [Lasiosphaeria miniovina]